MACNLHQHRLLFSMSNAVNNTISAFSRDSAGRLTFLGAFATEGKGTGAQIVDPLASQGSLALSPDGSLLFAVNAASNTISVFSVHEHMLKLVDQVSSGGVFPNSLTVKHNLLYVENVGDAAHPANITGFCIDCCGCLSHLRGSGRRLSGAAAQPASIVFNPTGELLAVSEKGGNVLSVFPMTCDARPGEAVVTPSSGAAPFGSVFVSNHILLVSEAGPNALSSYRAFPSGQLYVVSPSVPNGQSATCWVSATPDGRFAYTSNAGSGTLTRYRVAGDGTLTALESTATTPAGTGAPLDSAIDRTGRHLYVLNGNGGTISVFDINPDGSLALAQVYANTSLPAIGAQGMAVL